MKNLRYSFILAMLLVSAFAFPQEPVELDGPKHAMQDPLLDQMVGSWKLTGKVVGRNAEHSVDAEWVLNHQFLRIHEKDETPAKEGSVPYEAFIMLGYDNAS